MAGKKSDARGRTGRLAALAILRATLERADPLESAVDRAFADGSLTARDRSFARALATVALRRLGSIDFVIGRLTKRPLPKNAAQTRQVLRLGLAQILFLDVADHAAVDTSVRLMAGAPRAGDRALKGLVNAVLRRAVRENKALLAELAERPELDLPGWLHRRWRAAYGEEECRAIIEATRREPPLDITVKAPAEAVELAARLGARPLPTGSLRLAHAGRVDELAGFADGVFWVQDAAAALPARLLSRFDGPVADLCAAPGGKTLQLAAQDRGPVTAVDRSAERCGLVADNLGRAGLTAEIVAADLLDWRPERPFPRLLLDAPCTATGTLRRHPDIAWSKSEADVESLADLQSRLLERAVRLLAPGGVLVYCVCSLEPEEGPAQIAALLERRPDLSRLPVHADEIGGLAEAITPQGDLRTLPCMWPELGGMDGFYAARIVKR